MPIQPPMRTRAADAVPRRTARGRTSRGTPTFAAPRRRATTPPPADLRPSLLAPLLRRLRLGRLARALLEQLVVASPSARRSSAALRAARVSFLFTRFGTWMRTRASTSPLPEPLSRGAPRPLMRSSLPSSEPAGIFSDTGPSGVGTSTVPPSAAVANDTGTCTTRSSPRRSYVGDAATCVTTTRSPGRPAVLARPRPCP